MMPEADADNGRETQRALTVLLRSSIKYVVVVADPRDTRNIIEKVEYLLYSF
jgi:glucose uptake protein GlcU